MQTQERQQYLTYYLGELRVEGWSSASTNDWTLLRDVVTKGLPTENARILRTRISPRVFDRVIPRTTLSSKSGSVRLSQEQSDRVVRLGRIYARAAEVFGEHERGRQWLEQPNRALDGQVPAELLVHYPGVHQVEQLLGRIERGIAA
ncbi:antitoxin Xre/MbcA/ParS toxin-binding domain-containing protein [Aquisalimonas sp.]|uniref:antitoxin Xre/MbcA/ParS toxin-binding domain-containing protein n=1 Tax=Aquisalimonas sp. TaxID=1872621 RepID=UPI0025C33B2F|nr:antitoxin Xre/MbcA/ParS toxin-binding domain-containing protein [Aquisalimonas sp.]